MEVGKAEANSKSKIASFVSRKKKNLMKSIHSARAAQNEQRLHNQQQLMKMLRLLYTTLIILSPAAGALVQVMASGKKTVCCLLDALFQ